MKILPVACLILSGFLLIAGGEASLAQASPSSPATTSPSPRAEVPVPVPQREPGRAPAPRPSVTGAGASPPGVDGHGYTTRPRLTGRLTERDAINIAVAHGLKLAISREDAVMAAADALTAASQLGVKAAVGVSAATQDAPMLYAAAPGIMPAFYARLDGRRQADLNLMAMVPIFTGGRLQALLRGARESEKAALSRTAWELVDTVREARVGYARVLLAREGLEIASTVVTQQIENVRLAEARFAEGTITMNVVLRARAELAGARQRENEARAELEGSLADLKATMGVDMASQFEFVEVLRQPALSGRLDREIPQALENRPDLIAARHDVAAAFQAVREARARYSPQVYAQAMAEAVYPSPTAPGSQVGRGYSVGIVAGLPILDGGERAAAVRRSQADQRRRSLQLEALELEVTRQVSTARANFESAVANATLAEQEVTQAREDLRIVRLRFEVGRAIFLEVLDSLSALVRARYGLVKARYSARVAQADLLRATGRLDDPDLP